MKEIKKNNSHSAGCENGENKKKGKKIIALLTLLILVMGALQINPALAQTTGTEAESDMDSEMDTEEVIAVTDIEISDHESVVAAGETISLEATVIPENATETTIRYTSSNTAIATVSTRGEVKGIKKGRATITISAGNIKKEIPITVKVATTKININEDYLILRPGSTYQLSAKALPEEADPNITYRSSDSAIATVSEKGLVTAKAKGTAAIIVSNEDMAIAVSVIVNRSVEHGTAEGEPAAQTTPEEKVYDEEVKTSEKSLIDTQTLAHLYETKGKLRIEGEGYAIEIDGKDIVNYNNEFHTDIFLATDEEGMNFTLNRGQDLCGSITLYLEKPTGKYLYLYNRDKEKYQLIQAPNPQALELTTPGKYRLLENKLRSDIKLTLYILAGGIATLIIGSVIYVIVKRKYWFW